MGIAGLLWLKTLTQKWPIYKGSGKNHEFLYNALYPLEIHTFISAAVFIGVEIRVDESE